MTEQNSQSMAPVAGPFGPTGPTGPSGPLPNLPPLRDMWQIAVAGNMDPRQHTPGWYRLIDCISDDEAKAGDATFGMSVPTSELVFDVGAFVIASDSNRWNISTVHPDNRERMIRVASAVFQRLNEIYISAYGINRWIILNPGVPKPHRIIANQMAEAVLCIPPGETVCQISFKKTEDSVETGITVSPSISDENTLVVAYNRHHPIPPQSGYYDVGPMIQRDAATDWNSADEYKRVLSEHIKHAAEVKNG